MADTKNYYEILCVEENASAEEIKQSYRKLAKKFHPDANKSNPNADAIFKTINEAYEVLGDADRRQAYDATLVKYISKLRAPNTSLDGTGIYLDEYDNFKPEIKLDDGGGNIIANVPVLPTEAVTGCFKDIKIERREVCDACGGSGCKLTGQCQTCGGAGKLKFYIDTAQGVETHIRPCKTCFGTGVQIIKECNKCLGKGMLKISKMLRVPVPKNVRDGLIMTKRGDGDMPRQKGRLPGDLKLIVKVLTFKPVIKPVKR